MQFQDLYRSVYAILRLQNSQAKIVGTGFVVNTNPILILTCNHVVGEGTDSNDGNIKYSITKRSDNFEEFDLRQVQISWLRAKRIIFKSEFDLALLEIDPSENESVAEKLHIRTAKALELSFSKNDREFGSPVEWLSTAAGENRALTPRFFNGHLVSNYLTDQGYVYKNAQGTNIQKVMNGVHLIEVDKLFIPGSSGSPIVNKSNRVIGYVHGFKSWPIPTNTEIQHKIQITENSASRNAQIKYNLPLTTSLSLGIDVRTIENFLKEQKFIRNIEEASSILTSILAFIFQINLGTCISFFASILIVASTTFAPSTINGGNVVIATSISAYRIGFILLFVGFFVQSVESLFKKK